MKTFPLIRRPVHTLARGVVEVYLGPDRVVITDEHGMILHVAGCRTVSLRQDHEVRIYGELSEDPAPSTLN